MADKQCSASRTGTVTAVQVYCCHTSREVCRRSPFPGVQLIGVQPVGSVGSADGQLGLLVAPGVALGRLEQSAQCIDKGREANIGAFYWR